MSQREHAGARDDEILPKTFQSSPSPNGAGGRAVGAQGRSLHDVLNDTVRYFKHIRQDALHKAHGVERAEAVKGSLTSAKSLLCVEVEGGKGDSCTITGLGEGAKSFFKHSPWGDAIGHSIAHSINQPFIVLTETKFSYRYIPVWARYSPHRTRVEAHANLLSP